MDEGETLRRGAQLGEKVFKDFGDTVEAAEARGRDTC